jgi:chromosome segregation ATPase
LPLNALAAADHARLVRLDEALPHLVTRAEAEERARAAAEQTRASLEDLREWAAPLESLRRLQVASADTAQRLNGVETLVACKVDRADLARLEELASELETYRDFKIRADAESVQLRAATASHKELLASQDESMLAMKEECQRLASRILTLSPKTESRALARELERQGEAMKDLCSASDFQEVTPSPLSPYLM